MAKSKSTKSKTLKAKTTRRAAKPAKKRTNPCPVAEIAQKIGKIDAALDGAKAAWKSSVSDETKAYYQERIDTLYDQVRTARSVASFLVPKSLEGVMLLLGSIDVDASYLRNEGDAHERAELSRRLQRSVFGIVRYLEHQGMATEDVAGGAYLHNDPHIHMEMAS
jgi:ParB-like chromosome segregation protein Spo0J